MQLAIFRSLLHESCGRIVNPVYGSAGLVSTESWQLYQAAVEAVLSGSPITQAPLESMVENSSQLFKACDIHHVSKQKGEPVGPDVHKVMNRTRFKRSAAKLKSKPKPKDERGELVCESSDRGSVGHEHDAMSVETVEDTLVKPNGLDDVGLDLGLGLSLFPVLNDHKVDAVKEEEVDGSDEATWKCDLTLGLWCATVGK